MTVQGVVAVVLIVLGTILDVPIAIILGIVSLLLEIVRLAWRRRGLGAIEYRRLIGTTRLSWGDEIPLGIEVWNRQAWPLAWLHADDGVTPGLAIRERALVETETEGDGVLRNVWTLAPFERVRRSFHLAATRRGVFDLGPVELSVGDLFARRAALEERPLVQRILVRPRSVPVAQRRHHDLWGGTARAATGLSEDPARFAGIREYVAGDPARRIHARASARIGRPLVKRFEPSRDREVLIALDVMVGQASAWDLSYDEDSVEELMVIAASLAHALAEERTSFGLSAAAYSGAIRRFARVPASSAPGQLERVLDLLARLSSTPSAPFEALLSLVVNLTRPGTTVLVVSARDPRPFGRQLRAIQASGRRVVLLACGPDAAEDVATARSIGIPGQVARLDGSWRTATHLAIAG